MNQITATVENIEVQEGCEATMLLRGIDINLEPILIPILEQKMQIKI